MDPRQPPQHPFSRNTASPYARTPFPPSSNQASFPPTSHPPSAAPSYSEHQRRPSDPPYYNPQRTFGPEGPPISGSGHSRHQSNSSVGHGTPVNRSMPPPSSPQQQAPQGGHQSYGPPPPRAPPVSVGPPSSFPSRELPRPGGNGGMSISSMLGNPSPASREPQTHYGSPVATSAPSSIFNATHASPRPNNSRPDSRPDYVPFRRPQTPDHPRPQYETRDHRANSAGSPVGPGHYTTPEAPRFSTPQQSYAPRVAIPEERREPIRVPNPNGPPQRPSSQPTGYNAPPREAERPPAHGGGVFGRRIDTVPRPADPHNRAEGSYGRPAFEERHNPYGYAERERERERELREREQRERERERDVLIQRERERERESQIALQREREQRERAAEQESMQREYAHQVAQRNAQAAYSRPPEQREQPAWMRHGYEIPRPAYEPIPEREQRPQAQQQSNGYEYPATTAPQYAPQPVYAPNEPRYRQGPPTSAPPPHSLAAYEAEMQNIQRQAQQRQEPQPPYSAAPQNVPYQAQESPIRRQEESQPMQQQRSLLGVNEINRRGRLSPLPQAVQGAQGQLNGPGREPSIKNEFSRMFSGIGSGVGSVPSPVGAGPQSFISGPSSGLRREDLETLQELQNLYKPSPATQGVKRRKLKEEERPDDESSTGRNTPSGRGKRSRPHNHHHHHHHHHRRNEGAENTSSPNLTPFKSAKGSNIPSPPQDQDKASSNLHHHHVPKQHHHHTPTKQPLPTNTIIPLPKVTIRSNSVLDSVANLPRRHLGHGYYQSVLRPVGSKIKRNLSSERGFASTPLPLPRFEGNENCTFTIKIPRVYLTEAARAEITERKAVWGTEIYTDDSDVIAACIHEGWFRGAWAEGIDVSLLGLELKTDASGEPIPPEELKAEQEITLPPEKGPGPVPHGLDCHVKILILPCLEKYGSLTRFGIRSREWGFKRDGYTPKHDGLSFKIMSVKFVNGVDGEAGRSGKQRSRIMARKLDERELEDEEAWSSFLNNGNGSAKNIHGGFQESFERGTGPLRPGDVTGIGMNSWWKPTVKPNGKAKEMQKERERAPPTPEPLSDQEMDTLDDRPIPISTKPISPPQNSTPAPPIIPKIVAPPIPEPIPEMEMQVGRKAQTDQERVIEEVTGRMVRNANWGQMKVVGEAMQVAQATEEFDPDTTLDADTTL